MPRVRVITGTARSGRADGIDALLAGSPDRSLLIVPTEQHAQLRTENLLRVCGRAAILDPPVVTFEGLVARILRGTPLEHARIDRVEQHLILKRALARASADEAIQSIGVAAETEGFLDHLLSVIGQLKQAAIEPEEFVQRIEAAKRDGAMDRVVAVLYAAYQDELQRAHAVDLQGMYWLARNVCAKSCPAALQHVEHLLLDEFDDFTSSEFRVIREASRHVAQLTFGFNVDTGPAQRDLYAIPLGTLDRVRDAFKDDITVESLDGPEPACATEFIASALLVRDAVSVPKSLEMNVDFLECHTVDHEIESIARQIKRLVRNDNVPLDTVALVLRHPASVAASVADAFEEFDIPVRGVSGRQLAQTALGGFVLHLLDAVQTWAEPDVVDVLSSPWFAGPDHRYADAFHTLARAARPRPTRRSWERAVNRLGEMIAAPRGEEMEKLCRHMPHAAEACAAFQSALTSLLRLVDSVPASATQRDFAAALDGALAMLPIDAALDAMEDESLKSREIAARDALFRGLAQVYDTDDSRGRTRLTLADFARLLRRVFALGAVRPEADARPAVTCLDMESARYISFDHVFLAGMIDGAVPAHPPLSALYGEDERAELRALGVPLDDALRHNQKEIILFQRMFSTARRRLTISWHRIDRAGRASQRSLFVDEVADRLPGIPMRRPATPYDALVPEPVLAACDRDVRNLVFAAGDSAASKRFPEAHYAAEIEGSRLDFGPCGLHDAVLTAPDNLNALQAAYGPGAEYSATGLEKYAQCPFAWFQDRVLHLFSIEPTEQLLDARVRGSVIHGALERFHREFLERAVIDINADSAATAMQRALDFEFDRAVKPFGHIARGLLDAEKARLARILSRYLAIAREKDDPRWKPAMFEAAFGHTPDGREGPAPAYDLALDGETVRIAGRIDRIDRDGDAIRLVDYKSSKVAPKDIDEGRNFQLTLYALATESSLCDGSRCESASYVAVGKKGGETEALSRSATNVDWDERVKLAREAVAGAIHGIRAGVFHPTLRSEACRACAAEKVCRYERARMLRKGAR